MSGIVNSTGAKSGIIGTTVGTPVTDLATATFPAGHVIDTNTYRIRNLDYSHSTAETYKVCTAISDSSTGQLSFSAVSGNTYIITYQQFQQAYRSTGVDTNERYWHGDMQLRQADIALGTTNTGGQTLSGGYIISGGIWGRHAVTNAGFGANSWVVVTYVGSIQAAATETLYVYMTSRPSIANNIVRSEAADDKPSNCVIQTIKGNKQTIS